MKREKAQRRTVVCMADMRTKKNGARSRMCGRCDPPAEARGCGRLSIIYRHLVRSVHIRITMRILSPSNLRGKQIRHLIYAHRLLLSTVSAAAIRSGQRLPSWAPAEAPLRAALPPSSTRYALSSLWHEPAYSEPSNKHQRPAPWTCCPRTSRHRVDPCALEAGGCPGLSPSRQASPLSAYPERG